MNEKVVKHKAICDELNALYARKNHDYGDSFHQTFVEEGMAMPRIRLGDKFSRFKTLTQSGGQQVTDESIRDTLLDIANYAIMTVLEIDRAEAKKYPEMFYSNANPVPPSSKDFLIKEVYSLYEKGVDIPGIVNQLGLSPQTVQNLIESKS